MKITRALRAFALLALVSGCGLLRYPVPNWAARDIGSDGTWVFHAKGDEFEKGLYQAVVDGTYNESGRAKNTANGIMKGSKDVAGDLQRLAASGATYWIAPDASGKLKVQIGRPGGGVGDLLTGSALDAFGWGDTKHAQLIEDSLKMLAANTGDLARDRKHVEWRMYGAVQDIDRLHAHEQLILGDAVTPEQHEAMLRSLLVALGRDRDYFRTFETGAVAVAIVLRSASSDNPGSVANLEATIVAMHDDAERAAAARKAFENYPLPAPTAEMAKREFDPLYAEIEKDPAFAKWKDQAHATREIVDFGEDAVSVAKQFSALSGGMLGFDYYEKAESFVKDFDPGATALLLAEHAPGGSKLRALYDRGKQLSEAYAAVRSGDVAGAAARGLGGKALVLVEDRAHVSAIHDRLQQLQLTD